MTPDARPYESAQVERPAEVTDVETPRGTWAILLVYAVILAGLWIYGYIELLVRR